MKTKGLAFLSGCFLQTHLLQLEILVWMSSAILGQKNLSLAKSSVHSTPRWPMFSCSPAKVAWRCCSGSTSWFVVCPLTHLTLTRMPSRISSLGHSLSDALTWGDSSQGECGLWPKSFRSMTLEIVTSSLCLCLQSVWEISVLSVSGSVTVVWRARLTMTGPQKGFAVICSIALEHCKDSAHIYFPSHHDLALVV